MAKKTPDAPEAPPAEGGPNPSIRLPQQTISLCKMLAGAEGVRTEAEMFHRALRRFAEECYPEMIETMRRKGIWEVS